jgi:hypothetical protein
MDLAIADKVRNPRPESWILAHSSLLAALILLLGFGVRLWMASGTFFNVDEAQHFLAANQPSLAAAYRASLELAHPPLLILVLHYWRFFGSSDFVLRLPSVIAGTVFCWLTWKWLTMLFGRRPGWIGFLFVTFLPPLIGLSAEVRQYSLLLCFVAASAICLEQALLEDSARKMFLYAIFLCLAILSHYSAPLFVGAIGLYSATRLLRDRLAPSLVASWIAAEALALGLLGFLYRVQVSPLKGSEMAEVAKQTWMRNSYFQPGHDNPLLFLFARTFGVFQFVFGQNAIGDVAGLLFFVGLVLLFRRSAFLEHSAISPRLLAAFLLLPFVLNGATGLLDIYPYGGTRHSVFLAMFALAGTSLCLAHWAGQKVGRGAGVALLIVAICHLFGAPHRPYMLRADQNEENMARATDAIRRRVPAGVPLFADSQTGFLLRRYVCPEPLTISETSTPDLRTFRCAGHRVISTRREAMTISAAELLRLSDKIAQEGGLKAGEELWIFQAGFDVHLASDLPRQQPEPSGLQVESFGRNIALLRIPLAGAASTSLPSQMERSDPDSARGAR